MSDCKAKMHQNRFWLGFRPTPRWGSLQRSPRSRAGVRGLLLRVEMGWEEGKWGGRKRGRVGNRVQREGKGDPIPD